MEVAYSSSYCRLSIVNGLLAQAAANIPHNADTTALTTSLEVGIPFNYIYVQMPHVTDP